MDQEHKKVLGPDYKKGEIYMVVITKNQLGVIYRLFKENKLPDVDSDDIRKMYSYVDRYSYDFDFRRREGPAVMRLLNEILDLAFTGEAKKVNERLKGFKTVEDF